MRIGLLVLSIGDFGNLNYYNNQEIGLAKALDGICDEVLVYRLILSKKQKTVESINNTKHSTAIMLPSKRIGTNGFVDYKELDDTLDALVCFSDTQIGFPGVYRWALKNKIKLIPYIGVCESHSNNRLKQCIIDKVFVRNISAYRKCTCLAKTPAVKDALLRQNINMVSVAPVGIDMTRLRTDYEQYDGQAIKEKYGFKKNDRIILFIGRLTKEKQPKKMIEIFRELHKLDDRYRLCIVGRGELRNDVAGLIEQSNLAPYVKMLECIPNDTIWELYHMAEAFVNLNQQEIYGMALLEAMYYGCKVVAWKAPGPMFIIDDKQTGFLAESDKEVIDAVQSDISCRDAAKSAVYTRFTWETTAEMIKKMIEEREK